MKLIAVIDQYVAFRRTLGSRFDTAASILRRFGRCMGKEIDIADVEPERVRAFLYGTGPITRSWQGKIGALNGLYKYAISRSWVLDSPLPKTKPKFPESARPYIYSRAELRRLFNSAGSLPGRGTKLEPHTFRIILILLYGAGLRISEALNLVLGDLDLLAELVTIRKSKFNKTRLVPLGADLSAAIRQYISVRESAGHSTHPTAPLFVCRSGKAVKRQTVEIRFSKLRLSADVKRTDGCKRQPRLHDLRHTFAVHRLIKWYQQGEDVQKLLPKLSTYLGHISLRSSQVYLTLTPELAHEASELLERYLLNGETYE